MKKNEICTRCTKIRLEVDAILKEAKNERHKFTCHGACVNWGSLICVDVMYTLHETGEEIWEALIEEAAPENHDFNLYIIRELSKRMNMPMSCLSSRTEW
jgi:hypothetical protein